MNQIRQALLEERISEAAPHLCGDDVRVLTEIVARLIAAYEPLRIYLFGSKARGDDGPDSDFDLMLIVQDDAAAAQVDARRPYEVLRGIGTAADVLTNTRERFESRLHLQASLPATIVREGKLLYAA